MPIAALYFSAAVVQGAIAAFVLWASPRRLENWIVVVILALSGGSSLGRGLAIADAGPAARVWTSFSLDLEWPISLLVLALALHYPHRYLRSPLARVIAAAGFAVWGALWLIVILRKEAVYAATIDGFAVESWLAFFVDDFRYWATMALALGLFARAFVLRPPGSVDRSGEYLLLAFAIGPLTAAPFLLFDAGQFLQASLRDPLSLGAQRRFITFAGAALLPAIFAWAIAAGHRRGHRIQTLLAWGLAGLAAGVAIFLIVLTDRAFAGLVGIYGEFAYLIVRPVILGYAILRFQLFDADVRIKHGFATTLLVLITGVIFFPVEEGVRHLSGLSPELGLPIGIAAGLAVTLALYARVQAFAQEASAALFKAVREEDERYVESRKREFYRAALERALDDRLSITPHGEEDLGRLRRTLGISTQQHESLLTEVREAVREASIHRTAPRPAAPGTLILGRYRVLELLGEGGGGRTYRCSDMRLQREVAVKEIDLGGEMERRARLQAAREARLLASVRHARVVTLHEIHEAGARTFLVMEYVAGGSLADRIARGRLDPEEAARVAADVLEGLIALHATGLVHRDVKPSNVLLDGAGRAKLADFGVAKTRDDVTQKGLSRAGTPAYMAPEQVLGTTVDYRADLYAVAALFFEATMGEPHVRQSVRQGVLVEEAIVSLPPPLPVATLPDWANEFMRRGLAKSPELRFQSAEAALTFLRARPHFLGDLHGRG